MSSWTAHQQRVPKSTEPGTDFYCPIGTPVLAPAHGVIYGFGTSIIPASGRWVGIDFDNGQRFRCMHHKSLVRTGGRVRRGEVIAISGASGYGREDWSGDPNTGGAHTHATLWPTHHSRYGYDANGKPYTIDFMKYADIELPAGGGGVPLPIPPEPTLEDIMASQTAVIACKNTKGTYDGAIVDIDGRLFSNWGDADLAYAEQIADAFGNGKVAVVTPGHFNKIRSDIAALTS